MPVYIVRSSQLRSDAAKIMNGLRAGDSYVVMHYKEPLGFITPEIPKDVLKKLGVEEKAGFRKIG